MIYFQTQVTVNMSMGGGRSSRVAGVSVIITCQDDKANDAGLTSDEYDQLVKVRQEEKKGLNQAKNVTFSDDKVHRV